MAFYANVSLMLLDGCGKSYGLEFREDCLMPGRWCLANEAN